MPRLVLPHLMHGHLDVFSEGSTIFLALSPVITRGHVYASDVDGLAQGPASAALALICQFLVPGPLLFKVLPREQARLTKKTKLEQDLLSK